MAGTLLGFHLWNNGQTGVGQSHRQDLWIGAARSSPEPDDEAAAADARGAARVAEPPVEPDVSDAVSETIRMADVFQTSLEELIGSYTPSEPKAVLKTLYTESGVVPALHQPQAASASVGATTEVQHDRAVGLGDRGQLVDVTAALVASSKQPAAS